MDYSEGQNAPSAGASHPVEELSGGPTGLSLQSDQHLDQHQAFNASTIQTQEPVHPAEKRRRFCYFQNCNFLKLNIWKCSLKNTTEQTFFNSLHFGAVHFRLASAHCTDCSSHIHDVLKPCQPITTASIKHIASNSHVRDTKSKRGFCAFYKLPNYHNIISTATLCDSMLAKEGTRVIWLAKQTWTLVALVSQKTQILLGL